MSTTGGTEQGTVLVLDDEKTIRKKVGSAVTDSGREVRAAADKPGVTNLIDILAVARGVGRAEIEARVRRRRATATSRRRSPTGWSSCSGRCASATRSCGRTRRRSRRPSRPGAEKARAIAEPVLDDVRRVMGFG